MRSQRQRQVESLLSREIDDLIRRDVDDPAIGFVTITGVEVSPDLRHAHVYVSVLGDEESRRETMTALGRARGFLRGRLGRRITLRYTPELHFRHDDTAEKAQRVEAILDRISAERGQDDRADDADAHTLDDRDPDTPADPPAPE
jgi:ribosome-binding factor A